MGMGKRKGGKRDQSGLLGCKGIRKRKKKGGEGVCILTVRIGLTGHAVIRVRKGIGVWKGKNKLKIHQEFGE